MTKLQQALIGKLYSYCDRYEITCQFWPQQITVFIEKEGVELTSFGGDFDFAVSSSIQFLKRINNE